MGARMTPCFKLFIICYGCMDVHYFTMTSLKVFIGAVLAVMDSSERAVMGLESRALSAWVTKLIVTIFSKTCNNS